MQLWVPECPPRIRGRNGEYVVGKANMLQMAGGGELHAVVLSCITGVGTDRAIESFVHYCINNPDVSERSDKNVDMSKLNTTVDKITQHMQRAIALQTSLEKSDYKDRWFDRSKLTEEIVRLVEIERQREKDEEKRLEIVVPKPTDPKETIIDTLLKARRGMYAKHSNLRKQLTLDIKRDFAKKGVSTEASREELMQETLFALTETIRRRDRYNVAK